MFQLNKQTILSIRFFLFRLWRTVYVPTQESLQGRVAPCFSFRTVLKPVVANPAYCCGHDVFHHLANFFFEKNKHWVP